MSPERASHGRSHEPHARFPAPVACSRVALSRRSLRACPGAHLAGVRSCCIRLPDDHGNLVRTTRRRAEVPSRTDRAGPRQVHLRGPRRVHRVRRDGNHGGARRRAGQRPHRAAAVGDFCPDPILDRPRQRRADVSVASRVCRFRQERELHDGRGSRTERRPPGKFVAGNCSRHLWSRGRRYPSRSHGTCGPLGRKSSSGGVPLVRGAGERDCRVGVGPTEPQALTLTRPASRAAPPPAPRLSPRSRRRPRRAARPWRW